MLLFLFFKKVWLFKIKEVPLRHENPPSLFTMLKSAGRFVVNSFSFGLGFNYKVSDVVSLKAAYFQTNYDDYKRVTSTEPLVSDTFTRTNRVLGIGCELNF